MKKINNFAGVDMFIDGQEYVIKCKKCGKELSRTDKKYLDENWEIATEDFPLELAKEHKKEGCPALWTEAEKEQKQVLAHGIQASVQDVYNMLAKN